jgi:hypothetical protein
MTPTFFTPSDDYFHPKSSDTKAQKKKFQITNYKKITMTEIQDFKRLAFDLI